MSPNAEEVAAKVMDGEAIMINLSNGMYYSMDQVGGRIWELIAEERRLEEIVAAVIEQYDVRPAEALADVERLAAELLAEKLVLVSGQETPSTGQTISQGSPSTATAIQQKLAYEPPQLNAYRDMGDLLALDPPMPGLKDLAWQADEDGVPS